MGDTIKVVSTLKQEKDLSWPLALHEKDDAHPDGEVYIKGTDEFEVGRTAGVSAAIQAGKLKVVSGTSPVGEPQSTPANPSGSASGQTPTGSQGSGASPSGSGS